MNSTHVGSVTPTRQRLRRVPVRRAIGVVSGMVMMYLLLGPVFAQAPQAGRVGRAIVVALTPGATARYPDKTAHDYPQGILELREGMALSELHTITTDSHGKMCMVLTPGALLCVRPSTQVKLDRLEQLTDGLPETGKDLQRRIELSMMGGAMLIHAGVPSANMTLRMVLPVGTVSANGGEFVVAEDKGSWVVGTHSDGTVVVDADGARTGVPEGQLLRLKRDAAGRVTSTLEKGGVEPWVEQFDMCLEFFDDLDRYVFLPTGTDVGGLEGWMGIDGGIAMTGDPTVWSDVSPSISIVPPSKMSGRANAAQGPAAGGVWSPERIWAWYRSIGVIRGVNYLPRTAVNSVEFWQADTFNTNVIDEELRWANDVGINSVRVQLQYAVWAQDPEGFCERLDQFLDIADRHHLTVAPVLFDDLNRQGKDPVPGKQPDPVPGVHNGQWVPSPGPAAIQSEANWASLEKYVRDVVGGLRKDRRVLFWDLYNVPGSSNMGEKSLALLESTFRWVRQEKTGQPVTAAVWGDASDAISGRLMELSDLVTFQAFDGVSVFTARLRACAISQRPVVCTDWLKRQDGNTFPDILPVMADKGVGWFSRGWVRGRAQFFVPDESKAGAGEPKVWQQDMLWPDGKPYDRKEIELIKAFRFRG